MTNYLEGMTMRSDLAGLYFSVHHFQMSFHFSLLYNAYILPTLHPYFQLLARLFSSASRAAVSDFHS